MKENSGEIQEKPKLGLSKLPEVLLFLESQVMKIAIEDIEGARKYLIDIGHSLPLVRDGFDGIRADYQKRNDNLQIWFTNGFQDPNNEKRKLIEKWILDNFS